jgi:hypothetical protein
MRLLSAAKRAGTVAVERSISRMRGRRAQILILAAVVAALTQAGAVLSRAQTHTRRPPQLLVLGANGHVYERSDPYLTVEEAQPFAKPGAVAPPALHHPLSARAASSHRPSVTAALAALKAQGAITPASYSQYLTAYQAAQRTLRQLSGTRRSELGSVLTNVQAIAASGGFLATRLPALFLTLERNRQWWSTGPLLSYARRVSFPGSEIVWESYPGQGIEIQWLATFGEANGYYLAGNENSQLRALLAEVIPLATRRAGGIAWEYFFQFDGGMPPWTSGLSQGTALQVLSRAYSRFKETAYLTAAQQSLGIFQTPPPSGVRVQTPAGAEYAEYSYAPSDRILNGFIQSLVGLYDYTQITKDTLGQKLFEAGDAEARAETPHYDTGAWSMYDQHTESDLNYHELLEEFLKHLCERTSKGEPLPPPAPAPAPTPTSTVAPSGGSAPTSTTTTTTTTATVTTATTVPVTPIAGDETYCTTATHFAEYLHDPPVVELLTSKVHARTRAGVTISLSKVSAVKLVVSRGGRVVWTNSATVEGGKPKLLWVTPAGKGEYSVSVSATDLADNSSSTTGKITVTG